MFYVKLLKEAPQRGVLLKTGIKPPEIPCEVCAEANIRRGVNYTLKTRGIDIGDLMYMDLVTRISPLGPLGEKYYLFITDDAIRARWIYPLKFKDEAVGVIKSYY